MSLSKIKKRRLRKKFNNKILNFQESRTISQKEICTVGILTTDIISSKIDIQKSVESILGVRNSKMYSFKKLNTSDDESSYSFSEKDINWKGEFVQPNFQSFLDTPFDLLIGYFSESHLYLEIAILKSKAGFKAGFSSVNTKLYDLEILEKIENSNQFFSELKKYLKILKKLKN